ncbi:Type IV secretory pathway, VirD2 components (relaxase) (plasmid) [Acidisarcina polymorpha]|uniref:Type IV secretory pathway, VirD2 components (Relaxase) n=1 Tax=Acidisarcina polymorpha TaxID=2211140 RepID=A0A2Z5GBK4_9BACT|nr:DUF3363 domain-containing protein [Acidisarcina polymorpha]AXC16421.1 Type IV secretory pathway, VirD2 components (relaxase) [Acidisarcina polymorpha]
MSKPLGKIPATTKPKSSERERSVRLRPGRQRAVNTTPRVRSSAAAKNLFRLVRLVSRSPRAPGRVGGQGGSSRLSNYMRRAVVNVRYKTSKSPRSWKAHGAYLERESATRPVETEHGREHDPSKDRLGVAKEESLAAIADRWQRDGDARIWKIIVSPEDSGVDFERTAKTVISAIERETGHPVEWAGIVHRNTDHAHAHLVIRGRSPDGKPLDLPRTVIRQGLREAVRLDLTHQLGPRTIADIERQKTGELTTARVTSLDRSLARRVRDHSSDGAFQRLLRTNNVEEQRRLNYLKTIGLARQETSELWLLRTDFVAQLTQMKDLQDRARTLFRSGVAISDPHAPMEFLSGSRKFIGRVLLNSEDERTGAMQTIFETIDGRIQIIRHDSTLRAAWERGDLRPGNLVSIDFLKSSPERLYAVSLGADQTVLTDKKALDVVLRKIDLRELAKPELEKGWMGQFRKALSERARSRPRDRAL